MSALPIFQTEKLHPSVYHIALMQVPGIGPVLARNLVSYLGSSEAVFHANKAQLLKVPGVGEVAATSLKQSQPIENAKRIWDRLQRQQDHVIFFTDELYPQRLRTAADAPLMLYVRAQQADMAYLNPAMSIAVVGTRKCTDYGKAVCEDLVKNLATTLGNQVVLISGLAYGIDAVAHKAAVNQQVQTWGIMATGLDMVYPAVHKPLAQAMVQQGGALMTELDFDTKPEAHQFPARNRIIAALADVTLVVEAAATGGALITAQFARGYGRKVLAVPGNLYQRSSDGTNQLLARQEAIAYTSVDQLLTEMQWSAAGAAAPKKAIPTNLPADQQLVVNQLASRNQVHIDELARLCNMPINQVASLLLGLEFEGLVKSRPGKNFSLAL